MGYETLFGDPWYAHGGQPTKRLLEAAAADPDQAIFSPDWQFYSQMQSLLLRDAVLLSLSISPAFADQRGHDVMATLLGYADGGLQRQDGTEVSDAFWAVIEKLGNRIEVLRDYKKRYRIAESHLSKRGGLLPQVDLGPDSISTAVVISEFSEWVKSMGWDVPDQFTNLFHGVETPEERQNRIHDRAEELRDSGIRGFVKKTAEEEGISQARVGEIRRIVKARRAKKTR